MFFITYLFTMIIWNGILRIGSLKLEGLEGMLITFLSVVFTCLSSFSFCLYLLFLGKYQTLLYTMSALIIIDFISSFYFRWLSKYDVTFGIENGKLVFYIQEYKEKLGLHRYEP